MYIGGLSSKKSISFNYAKLVTEGQATQDDSTNNSNPRCSMYGIVTFMWAMFEANVGKLSSTRGLPEGLSCYIYFLSIANYMCIYIYTYVVHIMYFCHYIYIYVYIYVYKCI